MALWLEVGFKECVDYPDLIAIIFLMSGVVQPIRVTNT